MEKLSGVISRADENYLTQLLSSDQEAREVWQSLDAERAQLDVDSFLSDLRPEYSLDRIKSQVKSKRSVAISPAWRYAAAAVLLVSGIFFYRFYKQTDAVEFPVVAATSDRVQLLTDDGQTIDLGGAGESVVRTARDVEIHLAGQELQSVQSEKVVMSTLVVPPKLSYRAILPDGSKVWVNSGSKLHFPSQFDGPVRAVTLEGEGYFEIAKDKQKPFIVHAGGTEIEVLGTQFNVSSYEKEPTRTALVSGSVKVSANNEESVVLHPGFMSEFSEEGFKQSTFDVSEAIAWIDGIYYFNNASLIELAPIINRWYGLSVKLMDGNLTKSRISGLLERDRMTEFLSDLHTSTGISHRVEDGTLIFFN